MKKSTIILAFFSAALSASQVVYADSSRLEAQSHPKKTDVSRLDTAAEGLSEDTSEMLTLPHIRYYQPLHPERLSLGTVLTVSDESSVAKNLTNTDNPSLMTRLGESTAKFLNALGIDTSQPGPLSRFESWLSIRTVDDIHDAPQHPLHKEVTHEKTAITEQHQQPKTTYQVAAPRPVQPQSPVPTASSVSTSTSSAAIPIITKPAVQTVAPVQTPTLHSSTQVLKQTQNQTKEAQTHTTSTRQTPAMTLKAELMSAEVGEKTQSHIPSGATAAVTVSQKVNKPSSDVANSSGAAKSPSSTLELVKWSPDERELRTVSPTHYTIVLFDGQSESEANRFIASQRWTHKVRLYRHWSHGVEHFEVVMGDFVDRNSSLIALAQLPASVQRYSPDTQMYSVIHERLNG